MKKHFVNIIIMSAMILSVISTNLINIANVDIVLADTETNVETETQDNSTKRYIGSAVNAGNNDYSESIKIKTDDLHFGWELGQFYVSGFTQVSFEEDGTVVFLKNVGDKVGLYFNLQQDINKLHGNDNLSIASDDNGSDENLGVEKTNFKHGALVIRYTDYENKKHEPTVYTDFLKAKAEKNANTKVELFEEGDYEISLNYEIKDDGFLMFNSYPNYKIAFKFKVRNGNCMVYPFDVTTKGELTNSAFTENGFYIDFAKSRYLETTIKKEILIEGENKLTEDNKDTRFNTSVKDGDEFTDEGIYTINVKNKYTKAETTKVIYVGNNDVLKAHVTTGLSIDVIQQRVDQGAVISDEGDIVSSIDSKESEKQDDDKKNDEGTIIPICITMGIIVFLVVVILLFMMKKNRCEQKDIVE